MLDKLRDNSRSFGMYLIFGALIFVFVIYFGPASDGCMGAQQAKLDPYAATVNGKRITWREFDAEYRNLYNAYQQQMGERFNPELAEQLGLRTNALDRLIERRLLIDEARAHGLAVSDEEVAKQLREITAFHKDGQFDFDTYRTVLRGALGLTPDKFEEQVRGDLLRNKMLTQIRQGAKASEEELRAEFEKDNNKAELAVIRFSPTQLQSQVHLSDEDVAAYLATEEGKAAVEAEYEEKAFRFKTPKRVRAQHILISLDENATEEQVAKATATLEEARTRVEGGADFGEVAEELSEDPGTKEKGGDLGFFGPGTMAREFEQAAMSLEPGQLSELVRTRFGLHLIKVNEVQPEVNQTLEEVQDELARELLVVIKAEELAKSMADEALAKGKAEGGNLLELYPPPAPTDDELLKAANANVAFADRSGLFAVGTDYIPKIGSSPEVAKAVSLAQKGEMLPEVYEVSGNYFVAELIDRRHPNYDDFERRKDDLRARVLSRKENELVESYTKYLLEKASIEKSQEISASRM